MLRIRKFEDDGLVIFALSGRIEEIHVPELQELLKNELETAIVAIDLEEVRLVDRQVVKFLATCETRGVQLKNCPSYVREWIELGAGASDSSQPR